LRFPFSTPKKAFKSHRSWRGGKKFFFINRLSTGYQQVINSLSTAYQQVINRLSTAYQQLINSLSTGYQQLINSLSTAYQQVVNRIINKRNRLLAKAVSWQGGVNTTFQALR
jgi:hypothetical protein